MREEKERRYGKPITDEKAVLSALESAGRPMTVYEIRFREAMKAALDRKAHRRIGGR